MTKIHACVEEVTHSNIMVGDRGSRYKANFKNAQRHTFRKIRVDGCLINDGPRADWIVTKVDVGSVIIEVKGRDIDRACTQLLETLANDLCKEWLEKKKALLIVCNRVPAFDATIAKAQVKARKAGVRLKASCGGGTFEIEDLVGS